MADDPSQSVADPIASDPNIIPPPRSASISADRPVSTILADPGSDYTAPVPANLSGVVSAQTDSPVATESASLAPSPSTVSADSESRTPDDSQATVPAESSVATQSATLPSEAQGATTPPPPPPVPEEIPAIAPQPAPELTPSPPPETTKGGSIQDPSPLDQPSQVQLEVPVTALSPEASQIPETPPQSAEIKPKPPQGTQNAPLADSDSQKSSFGDLTSDQTKPISPPVSPQSSQPPQSPTTSPSVSSPSFGDLIGKPPVEEATINIEPIEPLKPVQPQSHQSPVSPLSTQPPTETVTEAKADFSVKRQQALQTRRKKRDDHLAKILTLISQKGKIHNNDIVTFLRVSQSTATNYLHSLVKDGKIKKEGKAKATVYSLM